MNVFSKKRLRWLKAIGVIGCAIIILIIAELGVTSEKEEWAVKNDYLSVKDVTRAVRYSGLTVTSNSIVNPADYKMGEVEPNIYQVQDFDGMLFIYQFSSIGERNRIYQQWRETNTNNISGSIINMFYPKWQMSLAFAAKNTIIVVCLNSISSEEYTQKISPVLLNLGKTIFYKLNHGQQTVYQGEGENWKGKVIVNYYNNFWTDDLGNLKYEGWNNVKHVLKFNGDTNSIKGNFSYEIKSSIGKSGGTDSNGFDARRFSEMEDTSNYGSVMLPFGAIGGSGAMPPKGDGYTVTVKWNNQQETFELKATE